MEQQEILFRGKRVDNGKWIEGNLVKTESKETYIFNYYFIPSVSVPSNKFIEVIPETVGQYSGLKDKNETKIFSGDQYKTKYGYTYTVYLKNGAFCGGLNYDNCSPLGWCSEEEDEDLLESNFTNYIEVIRKNK